MEQSTMILTLDQGVSKLPRSNIGIVSLSLPYLYPFISSSDPVFLLFLCSHCSCWNQPRGPKKHCMVRGSAGFRPSNDFLCL